jgi:hypothetical protein
MKTTLLIAAGLTCATSFAFAACSRDAQAMTPQSIEQQYGVSGAYNESVSTPDGKVPGTIVPVTLADGRTAQLFIPAKQAREPHAIYMRDNEGLHPVQVKQNSTRDQVTKSPTIVERQPEAPHTNKRTWEKEALIIGGSAGAGTAIGAVAGGKKGAAIGAAAGGIGGLIYDMATRDGSKK